ncbi:SEC-C domain-containing protein [Paenibacillus glucanolyticus]
MEKDIDTCLCGSTLKYQDCCGSEIKIDENNIFYPEKFVVNPLLNSSDKFARFYNENKQNISKEILWYSDQKFGFSAADVGSHYQIHISDPNEIILDDYSIAHEMTHCIYYAKGFPLLNLRKQYLSNAYAVMMAEAIQTMLHDLLVQSFLSCYDYRLKRIFIQEKETEKEGLMKFGREPIGEFDTWIWNFNFASAILDWHQINPQSDYAYFSWYSERYPNIAREGRRIADQVLKSEGYDTPEKMKMLLNMLIETNGLNKYFIKIT